MSAELPTAVAVSDMQEQTFRAGAMPAVGGYLSLGDHFALGMRVRAGVLAQRRRARRQLAWILRPADSRQRASPRARSSAAAFFEVVAGGGITGSDVVPAFEAGAGYMFDFEHFSVGPSARYVHLQRGAMAPRSAAPISCSSASTVQLGHEHHRVVMPRIARVVTEPPPAPPADAPDRSRYDDDRIVDSVPSCADLLEFLDEGSGCGPGSEIDVQGDRIILDDRVLFDTDHAHVHTEGRDDDPRDRQGGRDITPSG